jgi:ubiquinone biosynthesis monooxygenase Coq7
MSEIQSSAQILRVNHAGELGAISVYTGQILISRLLHPACVPALSDMLVHERKHFRTFDEILRARTLRPCHALVLWAVGGWVLGVFTAILGQRAVWICTAAIESTVNAHLAHQVDFLRGSDQQVLAAVQSIQSDEALHEEYARERGGNPAGFYGLLWRSITAATGCAIWLSTRL